MLYAYTDFSHPCKGLRCKEKRYRASAYRFRRNGGRA
jgi:hypothetical protein